MQDLEIITIDEKSSVELIEKKSKFIADLCPISSKSDAEKMIESIKNKYKDAKHHCFAFCVYEDNQKYTKCSDDGEPSGTAGVPILNVIEKNGLYNALIVVTRYFGGILLGTGGLTRAYSGAATSAIKNAVIIHKECGLEVEVRMDYTESERFKFFCSQNKININNIDYNEKVVFIIELSESQFEKFFENEKSNDELNQFNIESFVVICRKYVKKIE